MNRKYITRCLLYHICVKKVGKFSPLTGVEINTKLVRVLWT